MDAPFRYDTADSALRSDANKSLRLTLEGRAIIAAPMERVFERAFVDVGQLRRCAPPWPLPRPKRFEIVGAEQLEAGALRRIHLSSSHVVDERLIEVAAPERIVYEVESGWGPPSDWAIAASGGEHLLRPHPAGTEIVWRGWLQARSRWHLPLAALLRSAVYQPFVRRFLRSIARDFERGAL